MKHVLIVEGLDEHAFLLQTQLNRLHFLTSVCTDLFQIIKKIQDGIVNAITIDINLPGISGIEMIRHIRKADKKIIIVVITCMNDETSRMEAMQAGASYYIVKPYEMKDLRIIFEPLRNEII